MGFMFSIFGRSLIIGLIFRTTQAVSADMSENIEVTLAPGETVLESFQLTIADMIKTMTETTKVTMIQVSTQMVTQMQTVTETVSGTCAATSPLLIQPSASQEASKQAMASSMSSIEKSNPVPTIVIVDLTTSANPSPTASSPLPTVQTVPEDFPSTSSQKPCDCHCLCPLASFQNFGTMTASPVVMASPIVMASPVGLLSTFQTLASVVTPGESAPTPAASSEISPPQNLLIQNTATTTQSNSTAPDATMSTTSVVALSVTRAMNVSWTPASPTPGSSSSEDSPFDINTFSLHSAVTVPLIMRDLYPTGNQQEY